MECSPECSPRNTRTPVLTRPGRGWEGRGYGGVFVYPLYSYSLVGMHVIQYPYPYAPPYSRTPRAPGSPPPYRESVWCSGRTRPLPGTPPIGVVPAGRPGGCVWIPVQGVYRATTLSPNPYTPTYPPYIPTTWWSLSVSGLPLYLGVLTVRCSPIREYSPKGVRGRGTGGGTGTGEGIGCTPGYVPPTGPGLCVPPGYLLYWGVPGSTVLTRLYLYVYGVLGGSPVGRGSG